MTQDHWPSLAGTLGRGPVTSMLLDADFPKCCDHPLWCSPSTKNRRRS